MNFATMDFGKKMMKFGPLRLAVVLLGDRLSGAAIQPNRVDTFVIEAENPAEALRAELDARGLAPRSVALGLARAAVAVKPIDLPPVVGEMREMVRFELDRHLPFPADDAPFDFLPLPLDGEAEQPPSEAKRVLTAEVRRSLAVARWRACDAVWISGDHADGVAESLAALEAPVTRPPYTPRAERRLA